MKDKREKEAKNSEKKFKKDNILKAEEYKNKKDLINSLLEDNKEYSKKEVEILIKNYLDKEV